MTAGLLSKENILFFAIVGIFFLIIVIVCFLIVISFFRFIANIFKNLFHEDNRDKRIGLDSGEDIEVVVEEIQKSKEERQRIEQKKLSTSKKEPGVSQEHLPAGRQESFEDKNQKEIEEDISKLKGEAINEEFMEKIEISRAKKIETQAPIKASGPTLQYNQSAVNSSKKEPGVSQEHLPAGRQESFEDKNQKEIEEDISKLKGEAINEEFMEKIEISRAKKIETQAPIKGDAIIEGEQGKKYFIKEGDVSFGKMGAINKGTPIFKVVTSKPNGISLEEKTSFFEKPDFMKKPDFIRSVGLKDGSIFEGKKEISRANLRQKLESSKLYEIGKSVGLKLSPIERENLEREVFSQSLGANISKIDLKSGIKKLNKEMRGAKNMGEKGKIRAKVQFFKKIGGIQ